jgi:hypothetical protein
VFQRDIAAGFRDVGVDGGNAVRRNVVDQNPRHEPLPRRGEAHPQRGDRANGPTPDHDLLGVEAIGQQTAGDEGTSREKGSQAQHHADFLRRGPQLLHVQRHDVDEQAFAAAPQKQRQGDEFDIAGHEE